MNLINLLLNPTWLVVASYLLHGAVYTRQPYSELGRFIHKIKDVC
jgi:hypothetical protein